MRQRQRRRGARFGRRCAAACFDRWCAGLAAGAALPAAAAAGLAGAARCRRPRLAPSPKADAVASIEAMATSVVLRMSECPWECAASALTLKSMDSAVAGRTNRAGRDPQMAFADASP